jgi:hypothetical protein
VPEQDLPLHPNGMRFEELDCAEHHVPFDEVVAVMLETGYDLPNLYRETVSGGLAAAYMRRGKART